MTNRNLFIIHESRSEGLSSQWPMCPMFLLLLPAWLSCLLRIAATKFGTASVCGMRSEPQQLHLLPACHRGRFDRSLVLIQDLGSHFMIHDLV